MKKDFLLGQLTGTEDGAVHRGAQALGGWKRNVLLREALRSFLSACLRKRAYSREKGETLGVPGGKDRI